MRLNFRRHASFSLTILLVALGARAALATWSIQITDTRTGEVAIGGATCLTGIDLKTTIGVVAVGKGTGATQATLPPGSYRKTLFRELELGTPPDVIIDLMQDLGGKDDERQYGIADFDSRASSFTGKNTLSWAGGRTGRVGTMVYSVQGNIMVSEAVIASAEYAILHTRGDVSDKLMAGMEAARAQGGDSRCTQFGKSSHVAFMVVARMGDIDSPCIKGYDCATGTYFLDLDVAGQGAPDPDPVFTLEGLYQQWRTDQIGRPDHVQSVAVVEPQHVPADGQAAAKIELSLADWQGQAIMHGGAAVTVTHGPNSAGSSTIGTVVDHGDGTYTVPLTAGKLVGTDVFDVMVDDGVSPVVIYPLPKLELDSPLRLHAKETQISSSAGDAAHLVMNGSPPFAGRSYLVMLSASGTVPGFNDGAVHVPLNYDVTLLNSIMFANVPPLVNTRQTFDSDAHAEAMLAPTPGLLDPYVGAALSFAYVSLLPEDFASQPVQVLVVP